MGNWIDVEHKGFPPDETVQYSDCDGSLSSCHRPVSAQIAMQIAPVGVFDRCQCGFVCVNVRVSFIKFN